MAKIIAVVNQKGGVGKTTTSVNLAAYLARLGKFVLLVDLDPQSNATSGLGIDYRNLNHGIYDVLIGRKSMPEIICNTSIPGYKVAPATLDLAGANIELVNEEQREFRLHQALHESRSHYDYIIIDCPPSLGLLTINGLLAADEILIPVQAEYYALEGIAHLLHTVKLLQDNLKPELAIMGAVITMFDKRTSLSDDVLQQLYQYFPSRIFRTVIPRNVKLSEAPSHGKSICEYDPECKGASAYERLAREIIELESSVSSNNLIS
ncbi:ParA family protein [Candidatus Falkowbacteria bacterium]|nr:ParA family protein [Candidatus Falkowbacteria bacterium]